MKLFWFFRIGHNLVAVGRTGCLGAFFLLFNLPVLLTVLGTGALFWWRMSQFPTPLVVGCALVLALETVGAFVVLASRARGHFDRNEQVFQKVDRILWESKTYEQRRYQAIYDHIHAVGTQARQHYDSQQRRRP